MPELVLVFVCTLLLAPVRLCAQAYATMHVVGSKQGVIRGTPAPDPDRGVPNPDWIPVQRATLTTQADTAANPITGPATKSGYLHLVKRWDVVSPVLRKFMGMRGGRGELLEVTVDMYRGDQSVQQLLAHGASIRAISHRFDGANEVEELWLSYAGMQQKYPQNSAASSSPASVCALLSGYSGGMPAGDCQQFRHESWIAIQEFETNVQAALPAASFKVTKLQDKASPVLQKAMQTKELLTEVSLKFSSPNSANRFQETLDFMNVQITNIAQSWQGGNAVEEITFSYQRATQADEATRGANLVRESVNWTAQGRVLGF